MADQHGCIVNHVLGLFFPAETIAELFPFTSPDLLRAGIKHESSFNQKSIRLSRAVTATIPPH